MPVVQKHQPTPEQLRYSFKRTREITGIKRPVRPARLPKSYSPAEVYAIMEGAAKVSSKHRLFVEWLFAQDCALASSTSKTYGTSARTSINSS